MNLQIAPRRVQGKDGKLHIAPRKVQGEGVKVQTASKRVKGDSLNGPDSPRGHRERV